MRPLNVLSLFDGISCAQLALQRAGIPVRQYYASEIEDYPMMATRKHFPKTVFLGDVQTVDPAKLPRIDLLVGGSPCQGFSSLGLQQNFNHPQSKMFFEYVRLKNALQPRWFLLENVAMKKEYREIISHYVGTQPVKINSSDFSAQNRVRLYWTNIPIQPHVPKNVLLKDILEDTLDPTLALSPAAVHRVLHQERARGHFFTKDHPKIGTLTASYAHLCKDACFIEHLGMRRKLSPVEAERLQTLPDNYTDALLYPSRRYEAVGNGFTVDVIAHILSGIHKSVPKAKPKRTYGPLTVPWYLRPRA